MHLILEIIKMKWAQLLYIEGSNGKFQITPVRFLISSSSWVVPISVSISFKSSKAFLWDSALNILLYRVGGVLSSPEIKEKALGDQCWLRKRCRTRDVGSGREYEEQDVLIGLVYFDLEGGFTWA